MRIGIAGSSANPPHRGHEMLITHILRSNRYDRLYWVLTGNRKDKKYSVHPDHRVNMTELALGRFRMHPNFVTDFIIRYNDVYTENTNTYVMLKNYEEEFPDADIEFIIGSDLLHPQENGLCEIENYWYKGDQVMNQFNFYVIRREGYDGVPHNTPDWFKLSDMRIPNISSSAIRESIFKKNDITPDVSGDVAAYMFQNKLYRESV